MGIRSAIVAGARSTMRNGSKTSATNRITSPFLSSPTRPLSSFSRLRLASLDSEKPLHSAIASARLTSILALDSTCWTSLSQDFAVPR